MISLHFLILLILMISSVNAELVLEILFPDEKPEIISQTFKIPVLIEQDLAPLKLDLPLGVWQTIGGTVFGNNDLPLMWKVKVTQK